MIRSADGSEKVFVLNSYRDCEPGINVNLCGTMQALCDEFCRRIVYAYMSRRFRCDVKDIDYAVRASAIDIASEIAEKLPVFLRCDFAYRGETASINGEHYWFSEYDVSKSEGKDGKD